MKKILALLAMSAALPAFAQNTLVCSGTAGVSASIVAASFVQEDFVITCSNNVLLDYAEITTQLGVCAGSQKGNTKYSGNTSNGAITGTGTFPTGVTSVSVNENGCT